MIKSHIKIMEKFKLMKKILFLLLSINLLFGANPVSTKDAKAFKSFREKQVSIENEQSKNAYKNRRDKSKTNNSVVKRSS